MIKNESSLDELENIIGNIINEQRREFKVNDYGLLDKLDNLLYAEFLDIKAENNINVPFDRDATILNKIVN